MICAKETGRTLFVTPITWLPTLCIWSHRKAWAVCSAVRLFTEHTRAVVQDPFVLEAAVTLYEVLDNS